MFSRGWTLFCGEGKTAGVVRRGKKAGVFFGRVAREKG